MNLSVSNKSSRNEKQQNGLYVWRDPPASGGWNMAADEALARRSEETNCVLMRLYGWHPHTVSLGSFLRFFDFSGTSELSRWPVVRRPGGGGAIIHGTDLTYGLAVPGSHNWSRGTEKLYAAVHGALVEELIERHLSSHMVEATGRDTEQNFYCFNRRAFGDLVVEHASATSSHGNHKILGSAQRRLSGVVLQHGSLLLHRNSHIQGDGSHVGLGDVLPAGSGSVNEVVDGWLHRLADRLQGELIPETGPSYVKEDKDIITRATRYESTAWLQRR